MKFRTRLVFSLSAATALNVTASFGTATYVVQRSEERQLDEALHAEARQEASEVAQAKDLSLHISDRGGPEADDVGRLTKFAALYAGDGHVYDYTRTFTRAVPDLEAIRHPNGIPFELVYEGERLRAIMAAVPGASGAVLLLAAPRADLDKDTAFLRRVMIAAALLSISFTLLVTWRVVRELTRGHEAIAGVARRVAAGDIQARIGITDGDDEVVQLARDVDNMVKRLAMLVESQQRFVAHAAHELRSPLTSLYGELQLALRRSRSADEYKASIEEALDSTRRLKALTEDLLALARIGSGSTRESRHTPCEVKEVAANAAAWVAREALRRKVDIAIDADGSLVLGHAFELERLIRNLLDNAIRHSPEGGRIYLEAKGDGDNVELSVLDEGPGVPSDERERVFEPFYRASTELPRDGGAGLGLAIVREIVRSHGGDIRVSAGPNGKGALFRATLLTRPPKSNRPSSA